MPVSTPIVLIPAALPACISTTESPTYTHRSGKTPNRRAHSSKGSGSGFLLNTSPILNLTVVIQKKQFLQEKTLLHIKKVWMFI